MGTFMFSKKEQRAAATARFLFKDEIGEKYASYSASTGVKGEFGVVFEDRDNKKDFISFYVNILENRASHGTTLEKRYIDTSKFEYAGSCWGHRAPKKRRRISYENIKW